VNSAIPSHGQDRLTLCDGCIEFGFCRVGVLSENLRPDGSLIVTCIASEENEGGHGVAHGGWIASALDEALGRLPTLLGDPAVTAELNIRYLRPVPLGKQLTASARVVSREGRRWRIEGELLLVGQKQPLATGTAVMVSKQISEPMEADLTNPRCRVPSAEL
jgi:uncharacterized protein (TIGR00369 family)